LPLLPSAPVLLLPPGRPSHGHHRASSRRPGEPGSGEASLADPSARVPTQPRGPQPCWVRSPASARHTGPPVMVRWWWLVWVAVSAHANKISARSPPGSYRSQPPGFGGVPPMGRCPQARRPPRPV